MDKDHYGNCTDAKRIIKSMSEMILHAKGARDPDDKRQALEGIVAYYVQKYDERKPMLGDKYRSLAADERIAVLSKTLGDCICQLHSTIEGGEAAKDQSKADFMKMIHVENLVIKLQAKFRQILAIRRQERQIEEQKALIRRKEAAKSGASNEELVLTELKVRLAKRGMTPEAFFRMCDVEYTKAVPVSKFKAML